jgi:mannose-6-phosphate isomerase-like protein (cupin superfamily)
VNLTFRAADFFKVPDETHVSPFMNATDSMQQRLPWGALGDMSLAAGRIEPGVSSGIHVHPVVAQITYLLAGQLAVLMKGKGDKKPYERELVAGDAVLTEPGTLFQLHNRHEGITAEVLYIVSPSYVFEAEGKKVVYNDAVIVAKNWSEAEKTRIPKNRLQDVRGERAESLRRLAAAKNQRPVALAKDGVKALPRKRDYLAPDGSEIRLLAKASAGDFAHCLLPAGKTSRPVYHRTVEELWYVLRGRGELWRGRSAKDQSTVALKEGASVRIPVGTTFQFRAAPKTALEFLIATMPRWPGPREAVPAPGKWQV